MKNRIAAICLWVLRKLGYELAPLSPALLAALPRATALTAKWEPVEASGEYKRHQVYAELLKRFPRTPRLELSRAVDEALRRSR